MKKLDRINKKRRKAYIRMANWNIRFFELSPKPPAGFKYVHFQEGLMMCLPINEDPEDAKNDLDNAQAPG